MESSEPSVPMLFDPEGDTCQGLFPGLGLSQAVGLQLRRLYALHEAQTQTFDGNIAIILQEKKMLTLKPLEHLCFIEDSCDIQGR